MYTPPHLAEKILRSKAALEGERKQVTAYFCDVVGSTALSSRLDPEDWHSILDRFFALLTEGVHYYEGTVNQYTGDGIMALFGAPLAHEDHAERACRAALRIRESLRPFAAKLAADGIQFSTRMGLNSGSVVVGRIGDNLRMDYTAQGQTVMLAQRMEAEAGADEVYLTEHTERLVSGLFELREVGPRRLKGIEEPVLVHALEGSGPARTRLDLARQRGLTRFVGRDAELERLNDALGWSARRGVIGHVVGASGVGKSRLVHEFLTHLSGSDVRVFAAACPSHARSSPLAAIRPLVAELLQLDCTSGAELRDRVDASLASIDAPLDADVGLELLAPETSSGRAEPPEDRLRRRAAWLRELIASRSGSGGAVVVLEDLHWIDPESEQLLSALLGTLQQTRVLLLLTFRPDYGPTWASALELHLGSLDSDATELLLDDLLGGDESLASLRERIAERTGGTPLFVEETVRSLEGAGRLSGRRGAYTWTEAAEAFELPATVEAVIAARIDRLSQREKDVLQAAAVLGLTFETDVCAELLDLEEREVLESLGRLEQREFVIAPTSRRTLHEFVHALIRDVSYQTPLRPRRRELHRRAAQALERRTSETTRVQNASALAAHWEAAGESLVAARVHWTAAGQLGYQFPLQGSRHGGNVLRLLADHELEGEALELYLQSAALIIANAGPHLSMTPREVELVFREAHAAAVRGGDLRGVARIERCYALALLFQGDVGEAERHYVDAIENARSAGDARLADSLESSQWLQSMRLFLGKLEETLAWLDRGLDGTSRDPRALLMSVRGLVLSYMGELPAAERQLEEALALALKEGDGGINQVRFIHCNWTHLCWFVGDGEGALKHAGRALDLAREQLSKYYLAEAGLAEAFALLAAERWSQAAELLDAQIRAPASERTSEGDDFVMALLVEARLEMGELVHAQEIAERAIELAASRGKRRAQCHAQVMYARVLARGGQAAALPAALASAEALVEATGARGYRPFIALARAEGARTDAERRKTLRAVSRAFRAMGAVPRAARLERALAD